MIPNDYGATNNTLQRKGYGLSLATSYILCMDGKNFYSGAILYPHSYADFWWLEHDEIESLDVRNLAAIATLQHVMCTLSKSTYIS